MSRGVRGSLMTALFIILVLFIFSFFLGTELPFLILFRLVGGWMLHLQGVIPKVTVNWSGVGMLIVCLTLTAALGHGLCRWLWQGTGHTDEWRPRWTAAGLGVLVLMFAAGMAFTAVAHQTGWLFHSSDALLVSSSRGSIERNVFTALKTILQAQTDFATFDRDGNGTKDYWRKDIAGLYVVKGLGGEPIKLIGLSVAAADGQPVMGIEPYAVRSAYAGYWFRSLRFRSETVPDPSRFGALAYPDSPSAGKYFFIISEEGVLYRKPIDAGPVPEIYPDAPEKAGWMKLD